MRYLVLDIAATAIDGADEFLEEPSAPANYKDPEKIAHYLAEKKREMRDRVALDPDLGRITAIGSWSEDYACSVQLAQTEDEERELLREWAKVLRKEHTIITFNGFRFDLPCLMRRARYLGVSFPWLNLDRYRSPHVDLCEVLTNRGQLPAHSLGFYAKRLGWTDLVKPLSGAEEARALADGKVEALIDSVRHDVLATKRLAEWLGVLPVRQPTEEMEPIV